MHKMSRSVHNLVQISSGLVLKLLIVGCFAIIPASETLAQWAPVLAQTSSDAPIPRPSTDSPSPARGRGSFPVLVDVSILDIEKIDGVRMEIHAHLRLRQYWTDSASAVGPSLSEPNTTIWIPDTIITNQRNSAGSRHRSQSGRQPFFLKYNLSSQQLLLEEMIFAVIKCESMDFTRYPFDYQTCSLRFRSASDSQQVGYFWRRNHGQGQAGFTPGHSQDGNVVKKYDVVSPFQVVQISISQSNAINSELSLGIQVRRLWSAYVHRFYVPMTTFVATSLLSLWLVHPKISFVVNFVNIVSMNIFLAIWDLSADIPKLSYCTAMNAYSIICFVFIVLILILNVYILFYIKSDENDSDDGRHNESFQSSQEQKYFLPKQDESRSFRMRQPHPHPFTRTIHSRSSANASPPGGSGFESAAAVHVEMTDSPVEVVPRRRSRSTWSLVRETFLDKIRRSGHTIFLFTFIGVFILYWIVLLSIHYTTTT